jgi:hypothetical protein
MMRNEPIFIVGVPRSGTTLVRLILNSHSRIAIAPETHFFRIFWARRDKYGDLRKDENLQSFWGDFAQSKHFEDFRFHDEPDIRNRIFSGERSYNAILRTLLIAYAKQNSKIRWGEKTPGHLEYANTILDFYPDARIIHVIRDPRDVALAFKKVPWGSNHVFPNARLWNRYMDMPKRQGLTTSDAYFELRYEDLVTNPKAMIYALCDFIHEEPEDTMNEFYQTARQYIEKNEPWKDGCLRPLTSSNVGKWKRELSNWEIEQIFLKCERSMIEKGYIQPHHDLSPGARLVKNSKNLLFHFLWLVRRIFNKIGFSLFHVGKFLN